MGRCARILRDALLAAGVEVKRCARHGEAQPCDECERDYGRAEAQRARQQRDESRAAHQHYLKGAV